MPSDGHRASSSPRATRSPAGSGVGVADDDGARAHGTAGKSVQYPWSRDLHERGSCGLRGHVVRSLPDGLATGTLIPHARDGAGPGLPSPAPTVALAVSVIGSALGASSVPPSSPRAGQGAPRDLARHTACRLAAVAAATHEEDGAAREAARLSGGYAVGGHRRASGRGGRFLDGRIMSGEDGTARARYLGAWSVNSRPRPSSPDYGTSGDSARNAPRWPRRRGSSWPSTGVHRAAIEPSWRRVADGLICDGLPLAAVA